jgi:hypothetical protein
MRRKSWRISSPIPKTPDRKTTPERDHAHPRPRSVRLRYGYPVQQTPAEDPFRGEVFAFRRRRVGLIKLADRAHITTTGTDFLLASHHRRPF